MKTEETEDVKDMTPEAAKLYEQTRDLPELAEAFAAIKDDETYKRGADFLVALKVRKKEIAEDKDLKDLNKKSYDAWQAVRKIINRIEDPVEAAIAIMSPPISKYAAAAEAERERKEAEARAKAQKEAETAAINHAAELEKQGATEEAEAVLQTPVEPVAVTKIVSTTKVAGLSFRAEHTFEVNGDESIRLLARAVADGKVAVTAIVPNEKFLNLQSEALKEKLADHYPGVTYKKNMIPVGRGK